MKREILFRAKRKDNGEWIYGYPIIDNADCSLKGTGKCILPHDGSHADLFYWNDEFHEYESVEVDAETIGQYIGIKDRNGVKIFEDDIVLDYAWKSAGNTPDILARVVYSDGFCGLNEFIGRGKFYPCVYSMGVIPEVIGNIYDNQELLNKWIVSVKMEDNKIC